MNKKDFKQFLHLELMDIAEGVIGESIAFIFADKKGKLKGFRIYPKNIESCVFETYKQVKTKKEDDGLPPTDKSVGIRPTTL